LEYINWVVILQAIESGILLGAIYTLVALGFSITFGVLNIVNFAHGQLTMLSMYCSLLLFDAYRIDPFLSVPINAVIFFFVGIVIYQVVMRPTVDKPHSTQIVVTLGLVLLIQNAVLYFLGATIRGVTAAFTSKTFVAGPIYVSIPRLIAAALTVVVLVVLFLVLKRTYFGKSIRATADTRYGARLAGISVPTVYILAFGISAALEGVAGAAMVAYTPISPFYGFELGLKAFLVVVIAGLGSLPGAIFGGILIGIMETLGTVLFSSSFNIVLTFGLLVIVLIFKPSGLFKQS
jgi:branched-chain amino acid transport system permease protein